MTLGAVEPAPAPLTAPGAAPLRGAVRRRPSPGGGRGWHEPTAAPAALLLLSTLGGRQTVPDEPQLRRLWLPGRVPHRRGGVYEPVLPGAAAEQDRRSVGRSHRRRRAHLRG